MKRLTKTQIKYMKKECPLFSVAFPAREKNRKARKLRLRKMTCAKLHELHKEGKCPKPKRVAGQKKDVQDGTADAMV